MNKSTVKNKSAKPFLRWAGGKSWLKNTLDEIIDIERFNQYHEPFIGGGSILFHLNPKKANISDFNKELIDTYLAVKQNSDLVIEHLQRFKKDKDTYYQIRLDEYEDFYKHAARFIYLNQMSFNGIYRVNSFGKYNVPYGNREKLNFDIENLKLVGKFLSNVKIRHLDFQKSIEKVKKGDLVFLDPPYTIAHNENGFIQYNQRIFSLEDQYRLSDAIDLIKERKAYYILTNAAHEKVREIFSKNDTSIEVSRASVVGGLNKSRRQYSELIFTNI